MEDSRGKEALLGKLVGEVRNPNVIASFCLCDSHHSVEGKERRQRVLQGHTERVELCDERRTRESENYRTKQERSKCPNANSESKVEGQEDKDSEREESNNPSFRSYYSSPNYS